MDNDDDSKDEAVALFHEGDVDSLTADKDNKEKQLLDHAIWLILGGDHSLGHKLRQQNIL